MDEEICIRVGKNFYDFNVRRISITAKLKQNVREKRQLDHAFVFVKKNGKDESFFSYCASDNPVGNQFGSMCFDDIERTVKFSYEFKEDGMYTFKVTGFDEDNKEFSVEDFVITFKFIE